jgi:hypothetical protein
VGLGELVLLADVDEDGSVAMPVAQQVMDLARVDLGDLLLRLLDQLSTAGHRNS